MSILKAVKPLVSSAGKIYKFLDKPSVSTWTEIAGILITPEYTIALAIVKYIPKFMDEYDIGRGWKSFPEPKILIKAVKDTLISHWKLIKTDITRLDYFFRKSTALVKVKNETN